MGENRWQLGSTHQINSKLPIGGVFWLIADNDPIHMFLCHCPQYAAIFFAFERAFHRRAQERDTQLLGSLPQLIYRRLAPYLARTEESMLAGQLRAGSANAYPRSRARPRN